MVTLVVINQKINMKLLNECVTVLLCQAARSSFIECLSRLRTNPPLDVHWTYQSNGVVK